jgi:hypothetical protein
MILIKLLIFHNLFFFGKFILIMISDFPLLVFFLVSTQTHITNMNINEKIREFGDFFCSVVRQFENNIL